MIGLDTNVLIRLAVKDDAAQFARLQQWLATNVKASDQFFVNTVVLCESVWVLQSAYRYSKAATVEFLNGLLNNASLVLEHEAQVESAFRLFQSHAADFSACLISALNAEQGCTRTLTFDRATAPLPRVAVL